MDTEERKALFETRDNSRDNKAEIAHIKGHLEKQETTDKEHGTQIAKLWTNVGIHNTLFKALGAICIVFISALAGRMVGLI